MPTVSTSELPIPKSWDEFEDIVWNLYIRKWSDPHAKRFGRQGQSQYGIDIYGQPTYLHGKYSAIQCKLYSKTKLTAKLIQSEIAQVKKLNPPIVEYIIVTIEYRDVTLQQFEREFNAKCQIKKECFSIHFVFWDELCSELSQPQNHDLLTKYYDGWRNIFNYTHEVNSIDAESKVQSLREQIIREPYNDDLKRALGSSLIKLDKYQEAISNLFNIRLKNVHDLEEIGLCYIQLQKWGSLIYLLDKLSEFKLNGKIYRGIITAYVNAQNPFSPDFNVGNKDSNKLIQQALNKAVTIPNCPLEAFLWLDHLQYFKIPFTYNEEIIRKRIEIFQKAFLNYPDSEKVRGILASLLCREGEFEKVFEILKPLLTRDKPPIEILWIAFDTAFNTKDFASALNYLNQMELESDDQILLAKAKGDVLVKLRRFNEAIACYEDLLQCDDAGIRITGIFSKAYVEFKHNNWSEALQDVMNGVEIFFAEFVDSDMMFNFTPDYLIFGQFSGLTDYLGIMCCEKMCAIVLETNFEKYDLIVPTELKSRIKYLLCQIPRYE